MITIEDRLTVLLAEDDENDLILLRRALSKLATAEEVLWVGDGEQARAYLRGDAPYANRNAYPLPDILILDQGLPRLTGLEVLRWVRRHAGFDCLPVVVCSVFSPEQEAAVERLNAACCVKTGDIGEMHRALGQAVLCAFRMASLIPEAAWFRNTGAVTDPFRSAVEFAQIAADQPTHGVVKIEHRHATNSVGPTADAPAGPPAGHPCRGMQS